MLKNTFKSGIRKIFRKGDKGKNTLPTEIQNTLHNQRNRGQEAHDEDAECNPVREGGPEEVDSAGSGGSDESGIQALTSLYDRIVTSTKYAQLPENARKAVVQAKLRSGLGGEQNPAQQNVNLPNANQQNANPNRDRFEESKVSDSDFRRPGQAGANQPNNQNNGILDSIMRGVRREKNNQLSQEENDILEAIIRSVQDQKDKKEKDDDTETLYLSVASRAEGREGFENLPSDWFSKRPASEQAGEQAGEQKQRSGEQTEEGSEK
ncbi:hypothetical protein ABW19_dt0202286 [Dactylella cylindrospora]|nr:hypothetical protein ABW19_dt0202286 [Dactylella cylindrospora]